MKKLLAIVLALTMVLALAACGSSEEPAETAAPQEGAPAEEKAPETIELRMAHNLAEDHPLHLAALKFAEEVEKNTNGTVTVTIFPNAILGTEVETIEQLSNGALDMCRAGGGSLENFNSIFSAFAIPTCLTARKASTQLWTARSLTRFTA